KDGIDSLALAKGARAIASVLGLVAEVVVVRLREDLASDVVEDLLDPGLRLLGRERRMLQVDDLAVEANVRRRVDLEVEVGGPHAPRLAEILIERLPRQEGVVARRDIA